MDFILKKIKNFGIKVDIFVFIFNNVDFFNTKLSVLELTKI